MMVNVYEGNVLVRQILHLHVLYFAPSLVKPLSYDLSIA